MSEEVPRFRHGEAEALSDPELAVTIIHRQLGEVLRALPPGEEYLVLDLAETVECLVRAIGAERGKTNALAAQASGLRMRLKATSERLAAVEEDATLDKTGVLNKKTFEVRGKVLFEECRQSGRPLLCVFVDLDYFKQINDEHKHQAGDRVLEDLAKLLQVCCRPGDVVGRFGGEEFAILLPDASPDFSWKIMERLRLAIEQFYFRNGPDITRLQVTASVGGAILEDGDANFEALLDRADNAMYAAKNWPDKEKKPAGRNMAVLCIHGEDAAGKRVQLLLQMSPEDRLRPLRAPRG